MRIKIIPLKITLDLDEYNRALQYYKYKDIKRIMAMGALNELLLTIDNNEMFGKPKRKFPHRSKKCL